MLVVLVAYLVAAIDPASATLAAAALTMVAAALAGYFATRSKTSADLVDDIMEDRSWLRSELERLKVEVDTLKLQRRETEEALLLCRQERALDLARIQELEKVIAG